MRPTLYIDIDGVLQYAKDNRWIPRPDATEFLSWAVTQFHCCWLTNWANPNQTVPQQLGIVVPNGIAEIEWRNTGASYPYKASAINCNEAWFWLEDDPSEADIVELRQRQQQDRLILVPRHKQWILMTQIKDTLEGRLHER